MNNPQLDQAREWAESIFDTVGNGFPVVRSAQDTAQFVKSLPDEWIDAEKVRELIDTYKHARDGNAAGTEGWVMNHLVVSNLESLLPAPPLPTLADMTPEEREACQWMQAKIHRSDDLEGVIFFLTDDRAKIMFRDGTFVTQDHEDITPLPDLPRLEWPAQEPRNPETPPAETLNNASSDTPRNSEEIVKAIRYEKELCLSNQDFSRAMLWRNMERAAGQGEWKDLLNSIRELKLPKDSGTPRNPRPEDVPAGEPWIVKHDGHKWVGTRESRDGANWPWALARLDGIKITSSKDLDITLMSRLVPEVKP